MTEKYDIPLVGASVDPDNPGMSAKALAVAQVVLVLFVVMGLLALNAGSSIAESVGITDSEGTNISLDGRRVT